MNNTIIKGIAGLLLIGSTLIPMPGFAAAAGDPLPALQLKDSAGTVRNIDDSVQRIYASADRESDGLLKEALGEAGQPALDARHAIVVADISAAPGFVKYIIRSSLKDRRYATWIDSDGTTKAALPFVEKQVTVIELEQGRIKSIRHLADAASLKQDLLAARP